MSSKISALVMAALLFSAAPHAAGAASTTTAAPNSAPVVSVLEAQKKPISTTLNVTGSFAAGEMVLVSPQIEGLAITEIAAEEGDTVKKGQLLARLSAESIEIKILQTKASLARNDAALGQAQNQIDQAQISADRAKADLKRTTELRAGGISTVEQLDQRKATSDLAVAQLQAANLALDAAKADRLGLEATMKDLELQKSRTEIKAPVDGLISRRTAQVGGIASATREPMFNIVAFGTLKLLAEVAEGDLPRVKEGQKATVAVNGIDKPIAGEVKLIAREVNETTRIGLVHIRITDETKVPIGSFGRADIALGAADGVVLPLTAVTFGDKGPTVQVVENNKVSVRKVVTGLINSDAVEIVDGVKAGDLVVARAGTFVRDGDVVSPVKISATGQ